MTDISTNSGDMLQTEPDGGDIAANGAISVAQQLLDTYDWDDAGWKADPLQREHFRLSANIARDLGIKGKLDTNIIEALKQLGAVKSVTDKGKDSGKAQTNPDNPTGITARGHGFFVPPRVAVSEQAFALEEQATEAEPTVTTEPDAASKPTRKPKRKGIQLKDTLGNTPSEPRVDPSVELGEDGQPLEHERGAYADTPEAVTFNLNFGDEGDTGAVLSEQALVLEEQASEAEPEVAEATTAPPETPKAEAFPEFGSMDKSRVMGSVVRLDAVTRPAYLPASSEAVQRAHNLGGSDTLLAAVSYAAMGWKSFPLVANGKTPAVKSGFKEASADVGQLLAWFDDGEFRGRGAHSTANIGIATGETTAGYDLVVLDIDLKNGKDGSRVVSGAEGELGKLPETLVAQTPSGGMHYLFRAPKRSGIGCGVNVFKAKGEGLDIRADGGYIAASPSVVDGKAYQWVNDNGVAWLPDSWVTALQADCPVGGKRGAVSGSSNGDGKTKARGELLPMPEDVALAMAEHAVPSDVGRADGWLQVLSVLSAFEGGEALARHWSSTGAYADKFDAGSFEKGWDEVHGGFNGGVPMDKGTLFNLVKQHSPDWKTPEQRKREAEAAALKAEQREADGFGALPAYLQPLLDTPRGGVPDPVTAVTDDKAVEVLNAFIAKGNDVGARVSAGLDVGHDAEYLFIAGMLTMNAEAVKYQVEHNPVPKGRSSKYMTTNGKLRAVIMHNDGGKPETVDAVDMSRFEPDYVGGTADAVTRLANRIMLERDAALGAKPTGDECVLVRRVFELSPLGQYWRGNATEISKRRIGWSLDSAVENGLSRATRYATNTHQALSGTGSGLVTPDLPDGGGALVKLRQLYRIPWGGTGLATGEPVDYALPLGSDVPWVHWRVTKTGAVPTCTPENVAVLLALYKHRVRWNDMRHRLEYEGFPSDAGRDEEAFKHIKALASRNNLGWHDQDINDMVAAWAFGWRFHPAKEWIESKPWDGVSRIVAFADTVTVPSGQRDNWLMYFRRWALGAIHALYSSAGGASKHALVLQGVQSVGKTSWFRTLAGGRVEDREGNRVAGVPVMKEGAHIDPTNKDVVAEVVTWWLVELGELESTFSLENLTRLKAFTTRETDEWRAPFDRKSNTYKRRTAFVGTANGEEPLADYGGNSRWATVTAVRIDMDHNVDAQQLWAEVLHIFKTGTKEERRHHLSPDELNAMEVQNSQYVARGGYYDVLCDMFDWQHSEWVAWKTDGSTGTETLEPPFVSNWRLYEALGFTTARPPEQKAKNAIAAALAQLGAVRWRLEDARGFILPVCAKTTLINGVKKGAYLA